jgi:hypothetical protein
MKRTLAIFLLFLLFILSLHAQTFTDSNLPIVIITTDTAVSTGLPADIPDEPKVPGSMKIIYHADGSRNYVTDQNIPTLLNYNGRIGIEKRGTTSQQFLNKFSYGLKTVMADNITNNNVPLLNMPSENDWVLNSLAFDSTLVRDYLSYSLYRDLGNYSPRVQFCEVVINGDYKGLYIFMEKIKVDDGRVNIVKLDATDNALPELSGGYITKADKTTGGDPVAWTMSSYDGSSIDFIHDSPNPDDVTTQQNTYIYGIFTALQNAMDSHNSSLSDGYPSIIDIPSFIDFFIMNELASNVDGYQLSTFFHKDRNGKLRAGPIWDFNLTYGNDLFFLGYDRSKTDVWQFNNSDNNGPKFFKDLFDDATFKCYLSKRWNEVTAANKPLNYQIISYKIDQMVALISEAAAREQTRWGTVGNQANKIAKLKTWIQTRINWLSSGLSNYSACANPAIPPLVISQIHYHPLATGVFTSDQLEFIQITNNSNAIVNVSGIYLKELGVTYSFPYNYGITPNQKIYLAGNAVSFQQYYGFAPFGEFTRNLSNKSEKLVLADAFGNIIDYVEYQDSIPWPPAADGTGPYLQLVDVNLDNSLASSWVDSYQYAGINKTPADMNLGLFPNPAKSSITVQLSGQAIRSYEISDLLGQRMIRAEGINSKMVTIDVSQLMPGTYMIRADLADGSEIVRKIMILR